MFRLDDLIRWSGATPEGPLPDSFPSLSTDTRDLPPGCLFLALRGENFDGHDFAAKAVEAGAGGVVANRSAALPPGLPALRVDDTARALRDLAAGWRAKVDPFVLGVTGSVGKTTTKELSAQLLGALGPVAKTRGNWNNDLGLPKSILAMPEDTRYAVLESGTNHPGEIAPLAALMQPDAAILTNVGPVHIGNFGTEERIADEKANLLRAVPPEGFCVLDATNRHFAFLRAQPRCRVVSVSADPVTAADFRAVSSDPATGAFEVLEAAAGGTHALRAPQPGAHQIGNSLLAVAAARALGVAWEEIAERLAATPGGKMRWERIERGGVSWINDAYNANPISMEKSLETFAATPCAGRRIAALGDMGELGDAEEELHRRVGRAAAAAAPDELLCVGPRAAWIADEAVRAGLPAARVHRAPDALAARAVLADLAKPGDLVLVKASRSMALERALPEADA